MPQTGRQRRSRYAEQVRPLRQNGIQSVRLPPARPFSKTSAQPTSLTVTLRHIPAGRVSARAGQGLGVGILTARLGLKAMALLRPLPWNQERRVRLGAIRKQIVEKVAAITIK